MRYTSPDLEETISSRDLISEYEAFQQYTKSKRAYTILNDLNLFPYDGQYLGDPLYHPPFKITLEKVSMTGFVCVTKCGIRQERTEIDIVRVADQDPIPILSQLLQTARYLYYLKIPLKFSLNCLTPKDEVQNFFNKKNISAFYDHQELEGHTICFFNAHYAKIALKGIAFKSSDPIDDSAAKARRIYFYGLFIYYTVKAECRKLFI